VTLAFLRKALPLMVHKNGGEKCWDCTGELL